MTYVYPFHAIFVLNMYVYLCTKEMLNFWRYNDLQQCEKHYNHVNY